jgi:hypothetical protein
MMLDKCTATGHKSVKLRCSRRVHGSRFEVGDGVGAGPAGVNFMALTDISTRSLPEIVSLTGRTAVVTGTAWSLGKATARRPAEAGASVPIGDIDGDKARKPRKRSANYTARA